jgi:hypothetical protein
MSQLQMIHREAMMLIESDSRMHGAVSCISKPTHCQEPFNKLVPIQDSMESQEPNQIGMNFGSDTGKNVASTYEYTPDHKERARLQQLKIQSKAIQHIKKLLGNYRVAGL